MELYVRCCMWNCLYAAVCGTVCTLPYRKLSTQCRTRNVVWWADKMIIAFTFATIPHFIIFWMISPLPSIFCGPTWRFPLEFGRRSVRISHALPTTLRLLVVSLNCVSTACFHIAASSLRTNIHPTAITVSVTESLKWDVNRHNQRLVLRGTALEFTLDCYYDDTSKISNERRTHHRGALRHFV
jgi:hypothetical protein